MNHLQVIHATWLDISWCMSAQYVLAQTASSAAQSGNTTLLACPTIFCLYYEPALCLQSVYAASKQLSAWRSRALHCST